MSIPTGTTEKIVKMKKVKEGDFLLGLDNGYVVEIERSGYEGRWRKICFHTAEGLEAYLDAPDDMPVTVAREGKAQPAPDEDRATTCEHGVMSGGGLVGEECGECMHTPTGLAPLTTGRIAARKAVLVGLRDVRSGLSTMLNYWDDDLPDLLGEDEFPFHMSLEDMEAQVRHAMELIETRNEEAEAAPPHKAPTMTKRELIDMLENLDCPDDTPLLGYSDATDYVNIDGIGNEDLEGGPALVIETRADYDSRQF